MDRAKEGKLLAWTDYTRLYRSMGDRALRHPRKKDPMNNCLGRQVLVGNTANGSGTPVFFTAAVIMFLLNRHHIKDLHHARGCQDRQEVEVSLLASPGRACNRGNRKSALIDDF
jgi:hypothetical protein